MTDRPEPWLRGPIAGVPPLLQPAAHALIMAVEDTERVARSLSDEQLWHTPGGGASVAFHLRHLSGSTDRLLTYARGEALSDAQRIALAAEASEEAPRPSLDDLLGAWRATVERALDQLRTVAESTLLDARAVGRARLPSTVIGLLFHAAEHASRHTGQVVTTANIVRASRP